MERRASLSEEQREKEKEESRDVCCKGERGTEKEEDKWGKRVEEEERTNGKRREGQGKRKDVEEERVQQLLQVTVYLGPLTRVCQHLPDIEIPQ